MSSPMVTAVSDLDQPQLVALTSQAPAGRRVWVIEDEPACETLAESMALDGPFGLSEALQMFGQVADLVEYLHDHGIPHGLVLPTTIFSQDRQQMCLGVVDESASPEDLQFLDEQVTSWQAFQAPEVRAGAEPDSRSDVFSLGVLLHWLLTRKLPPSGSTSRRLPRPLAHIIQQAIEPDPVKRLQTVPALTDALTGFSREELARFQEELALAVNSAGFDPRLLWARHPRKVIASFVVMLGLVGLGFWGVSEYEKRQDAIAQQQQDDLQREARLNAFKLRYDRANDMYERGEYADAIAAYESLLDENLIPRLEESMLTQIARGHGHLKDFGAEYTGWMRLLREYPDADAHGEANDRVVRIAALALKRYGDLVDVSTGREFIVDGLDEDWAGLEPIIVDPRGDNQRGGKASDLVAVYAAVRDDTMYLRFQMAAPPNEGDQFCVALDLNAFAYDDSTEEWDYQIGVAKGIQPWIWDLRGSRNYNNAESTKLHGVSFAQARCVEISLPLSAIGTPSSVGIRAFVNYAGMRQANDVVTRKVLIRWKKPENVPSDTLFEEAKVGSSE